LHTALPQNINHQLGNFKNISLTHGCYLKYMAGHLRDGSSFIDCPDKVIDEDKVTRLPAVPMDY